MITSPYCRGALVILRRNDDEATCRPEYDEAEHDSPPELELNASFSLRA
ncbi:hypothetical protein ABIE00_002181 [Arthrobacter sp. OAP107]